MGKISKEAIQELIEVYDIKTVKDIENALKDIFKDTLQKTLEAELDQQLGYSKYDYKNKETENSRNGSYGKTVRSSQGAIDLNIPRDRQGDFAPVIVKKGQKDVSSIEDKILSMYAIGASTRDIHSQMQEIYGIELSAEMISKITDKILPTIREWQLRPLQAIYPIIYMDAIHFNVREDGQFIKKAVYLILGIDLSGMKDVLGIWVGGNESAKYWLSVLNEIKGRGVKDILISCVDGLSGFEQAINTVFPLTDVQRCMVHHIRYCCKYVNYKDRKEFCQDMKAIYTGLTEDVALDAFMAFSQKWGSKYPYAIKSWETNWTSLTTFYKYPPEIRKLIYTTNPIESLNSCIRRAANSKNVFPTNDSVTKTVYLAIQRRVDKWTMRIHNWGTIISQLNITFAERLEGFL